jgi:hypothetical protein
MANPASLSKPIGSCAKQCCNNTEACILCTECTFFLSCGSPNIHRSFTWAPLIAGTFYVNWIYLFLIAHFRRVLNIEHVLLCIFPASDCGFSTFRNPLSGPSSKAGCGIWSVTGERRAWYLYIPCRGLLKMAGPMGAGGIRYISGIYLVWIR